MLAQAVRRAWAGGARGAAGRRMAAAAEVGPPAAWDGTGTQEDLMYRDQVLVLDDRDNIVGAASKWDSHRFEGATPTGMLHRAFSVFLFDTEGKLLLQQRASDKITFPNVWTNTCCSHPLHGQSPDEVDGPEAVRDGTAMGVKRAAVRKLWHELGIPEGRLPPEKFKFLTRMHYCARDTVTHGEDSPWGEHEIDYILLARADVPHRGNPEEVRDTRYVDQAELRRMMEPGNGLLWSPWCRMIIDNFLLGGPAWWDNLDAALETDRFVDVDTVHKLSL